jgi:hypothetical protein
MATKVAYKAQVDADITNKTVAKSITPTNVGGNIKNLVDNVPFLTENNTFTGTIAATNLSGTNTGDETTATIKTKLGAATTSTDGYLTSANWNTFNSKGNGTVTSVAALTLGTTGTDLASSVATGTTTPVITLNVPTASATNRGALSSTDWSTFNGKQATITGGATTIASSNLTASRALASDVSGKVAVSATTATELGYVSGVTSAIQTQLNAKQGTITPSALTKTDDTNVTLTLGGTPTTSLLQAVSLTLGWTGTLADGRIASASTWNAKESALTFSAPLSRSTNTISMPVATAIANGYLSSTDWSTFNGKAPLASPTFTGTPAAPTASFGTNTTQLATTAFVQQELINSFNRQTASYTLVLADRNKVVEMNVAGANNLTVPLNSSVAFAIGTEIQVLQYGAGQTTIVATGGVTLRSKSGQLKIGNQYTGVTLKKVGTDEWYVIGNLSA